MMEPRGFVRAFAAIIVVAAVVVPIPANAGGHLDGDADTESGTILVGTGRPGPVGYVNTYKFTVPEGVFGWNYTGDVEFILVTGLFMTCDSYDPFDCTDLMLYVFAEEGTVLVDFEIEWVHGDRPADCEIGRYGWSCD